MNQFLLGAMCFGFMTVSLFFGRFFARTGDRLFAFMALAFAIMSVNQIALAVYGEASEFTSLYLVRLSAFLLILLGIWDKNRG